MDPVLYVADASTTTERRLLGEWTATNAPAGHATVTVDLDANRPLDAGATATIEQQLPDTVVVPLRIVWSTGGGRLTGPRLRDLLFGDPRHPRELMARIIHRRHPERATPMEAATATIGGLRERYAGTYPDESVAVERFGEFVVRMAGIALDVRERRLEGRRYKVPRAVHTGVQSSPAYKQAVAEVAEREGEPVAAARERSQRYLREMVATPTTFFIDWAGGLTRRIVSLGYREIVTDADAVARAREVVTEHPSALLWTHKSHLDGIAVMSVLYDHDFPTPHQMGGINMAFRGIAAVSRRSGVIFIRRTFADNDVYKVTLQQYLGYLLAKRFPFSWAFEGTRSRTGKLMPPRFGLLKYLVDSAQTTRTDDLHLVPVAISYDLIGEAADYVRMEAGQPKQAESLGWFMSYLRRLRTASGRMYVDFAEPVVVPWSEEPPDLAPIAFEIARRANSMVPVTLPALMFTALLGASPRALTEAELEAHMRDLIVWLRSRGVRMSARFDAEGLAQLHAIAEIVFERGIVNRHDDGPDTVFRIAEDQQAVASYHRNTIIHYFVDRAMVELALLRVADLPPAERSDAFWRELRWVRDLLKFEFFLTERERFESDVRAMLPELDSAELWDTIRSMRPLVAHATIRHFLEAYWVVADLPEEATVDDAIGAGEQAFLLHRISSRASIGKQMFANAFKVLEDRRESRQELAGELRDRIDRLERLRTLAMNGATTEDTRI